MIDPDEIASAAFQAWAMRAYEGAFAGGTQRFSLGFDAGEEPLELTVERPGAVAFVDGRVEIGGALFPATDADGGHGGPRHWPSGAHAVEILVARHEVFERFDRTRTLPVAFRAVLAPDRVPVSWRLAKGTGTLVSWGAGGVRHEHPYVADELRVDGGGIAIATPGHDAAMRAALKEHECDEREELARFRDVAYAETGSGAHWQAWRIGPHHAIAMRAGLGDGTYHAFTGIDAGGAACRVVVDLHLLVP